MHELELIEVSLSPGMGLSENQAAWLKAAIARWRHGLPLDKAFLIDSQNRTAQRDELLQNYASTLDANMSLTRQAKRILQERNKVLSGRKCSPMISRANSIRAIPGTVRQLLRILNA